MPKGALRRVDRSRPKTVLVAHVLGAAVGVLAACSAHRSEAEKPSTQRIVAPPSEFEMNKMPEESSATPVASASAAPEPPPPAPAKKPKSMQPVFSNDKGVSTIVGTPGAVFKVAGATLRIPEDALRDGKNVHFAPSKVQPSKGEPARVGSAFDVGPALSSTGPPFELVLPIPADDAGDVVLTTVLQSKTKDGKVKMGVSTAAPKSVDSSKHEALFELAELPEGVVFLAEKPVSSASVAAPSAAPHAGSETPSPPR